jgi:hypothetical protein
VNKCSRCGKKLTRAFYHGGKVYGSECIRLFIAAEHGQKVKVKGADLHDNQTDMFANPTRQH